MTQLHFYKIHILIDVLNYIEKRLIIKMSTIKHYLWVDKLSCILIFLPFAYLYSLIFL